MIPCETCLAYTVPMKRCLHFLLTIFFALLQCVAPLAHAHIDGHNADKRGIHLYISPSAPSSMERQMTASPKHNTPAIGIPQGHTARGDGLLTDVPASFSQTISSPLAQQNPEAIYAALETGEPSIFVAYQKPHPHAPPALR